MGSAVRRGANVEIEGIGGGGPESGGVMGIDLAALFHLFCRFLCLDLCINFFMTLLLRRIYFPSQPSLGT